MIALICIQTSYKLESTFPVIIVEKLVSFSLPSLSMLISKTFMPKKTCETNIFILFLPAFSGHRPARRECARKGLRSHASCHPYPIPQPVKVVTHWATSSPGLVSPALEARKSALMTRLTTGVYDPYSFRRKGREEIRASFMKRLSLCCVFLKCFNKL